MNKTKIKNKLAKLTVRTGAANFFCTVSVAYERLPEIE